MDEEMNEHKKVYVLFFRPILKTKRNEANRTPSQDMIKSASIVISLVHSRFAETFHIGWALNMFAARSPGSNISFVWFFLCIYGMDCCCLFLLYFVGFYEQLRVSDCVCADFFRRLMVLHGLRFFQRSLVIMFAFIFILIERICSVHTRLHSFQCVCALFFIICPVNMYYVAS